MSFYLKFIWFLWILGSILIAEDNVTLDNVTSYDDTSYDDTSYDDTFDNVSSDGIKDGERLPCPAVRVTNLGHSSALLTWNSTGIIMNTYPPKNTLSLANATEKIGGDCRPIGKTVLCHFLALKEDTNYEFKIYELEDVPGNKNPPCLMTIKTTSTTKSGLVLSKPEFMVKCFLLSRDGDQFPFMEVMWLPCGRKGYCESDEVPGEYFSIKYKMLYSRQVKKMVVRNTMRAEMLDLLPGLPYEIVVTSIRVGSANLETESDPQEILIEPVCSPVTSIKMLSLTNSSVFISWRPPTQCRQGVNLYLSNRFVLCSICDNSPMVVLNYSDRRNIYKNQSIVNSWSDDSGIIAAQTIISNLTPNTCFRFHILQVFEMDLFSFPYSIEYTPQTLKENILLAEPEFHCKLWSLECEWIVYWLPCGQTNECKDMKPGSYFSVEYRITSMTDWQKVEEKYSSAHTLRLDKGEMYEILVKSWDEYNNSKSSKEQMIDTSECY